jgi:hypothetical protein
MITHIIGIGIVNIFVAVDFKGGKRDISLTQLFKKIEIKINVKLTGASAKKMQIKNYQKYYISD